jgi:short-subunit dehydrogenase
MDDRTKKTLVWTAAGVGTLLAARALVRRLRAYDLTGKVVLITGARGLALVMAREFARHGATLALCARSADELDRAREDLGRRRARVVTMPCDVTDPAQVNQLVRSVEDRLGRIDVLVNNAGVIEVGPMETMTLRDYAEAMRTHYWGPLYTSLAVLPGMRRRHEGRIVNITSIGGKHAVPHLLPYAGSKFALVGLSEGMRAELLKDGIYVTTVVPHLMRTGSPPNATFKGKHRAEYAWFAVSDALPGISMSAECAARKIVAACRNGDAEVILTLQAKLASMFHGLFPGLTADILGLINRLLPGPGGIGTERATGAESSSAVAPSWLTTLSDKASARNNELGATPATTRPAQT